MTNDAVHDFILASQANLRIAAAVGDAWPEVRDKIVNGFLERLNLQLMEKLKGWESEIDGSLQKRYPGASFRKRGWEHYWLCLQAQEYGETVVFGVIREKETLGKRPFNDELFNAIPQTGTRNAWWEVMIKMRSPAANWRKPEVLWRMHTDGNFLQEVEDQLLDVAKISEPIMDRWLQKMRRAGK